MPIRTLDPSSLTSGDDWVGNNAAFTCPVCQNVFLVSNGMIGQNPLPGHDSQGVRTCPQCKKVVARVTGGAGQHPNTEASIEW